MNKHFTDININKSRFAEREELLNMYQEVPLTLDKYPNLNVGGGLAVEVRVDENGKVTGAVVDSGDSNTIIVSATGAGKTRKILAEYIVSCILARESMIVHDPKGENYCFYKTLLESLGYKVAILNYRDPMKGDRYNFLQKAAHLWKTGKESRALEIAKNVADTLYLPIQDKDDKFWTEAAINLFLCYFIIACECYEPEYVTIATIYSIHIEGLEKFGVETKMMRYLNNHKNEKVYELGIPSHTAPTDTKSSIFSVFTNGLSRIVMNEDIADMLTDSTFDVSEIASEEKPMALFIVTRDEAPKGYSTVVATTIDAIYSSLIDMAQNSKNNRLPRPVHFILEEFGNIAKLDNINDMMTASRSRGIRMVLVLQSLRQLYLNYDVDVAHVLIGNSKNLAFMSSTDMELIKLISERTGTCINPNTNMTENFIGIDRLMHLDNANGETLLLMGQNYPHIAYFPDLSCYDIIKPIEKLELKTRERLLIEKGVLKKAIEESVKKKNEPAKEENTFRPTGPNGMPRIPSFEEFMAMRNKQQEEELRKKSEEKKNESIDDDIRARMTTLSQSELDDLIARIDAKIAELEEEERQQKEELKRRAIKERKVSEREVPERKRPPLPKEKNVQLELEFEDDDDEDDDFFDFEDIITSRNVVGKNNVIVKNIDDFDLSVTIVAVELGIDEIRATKLLKNRNSDGECIIPNVDPQDAIMLVNRLNAIGTEAEIAA